MKTMRVRQKETFRESGHLGRRQKVSTRREKGLKTRGRRGRRRTFMSIATSTGKGMRPDKWTMRVKSGAWRIRRWMRVGSEGICRGRGRAAGI